MTKSVSRREGGREGGSGGGENMKEEHIHPKGEKEVIVCGKERGKE